MRRGCRERGEAPPGPRSDAACSQPSEGASPRCRHPLWRFGRARRDFLRGGSTVASRHPPGRGRRETVRARPRSDRPAPVPQAGTVPRRVRNVECRPATFVGDSRQSDRGRPTRSDRRMPSVPSRSAPRIGIACTQGGSDVAFRVSRSLRAASRARREDPAPERHRRPAVRVAGVGRGPGHRSGSAGVARNGTRSRAGSAPAREERAGGPESAGELARSGRAIRRREDAPAAALRSAFTAQAPPACSRGRAASATHAARPRPRADTEP